MRKWRNWQTHQLEGLAVARSWGFESPLPHITRSRSFNAAGRRQALGRRATRSAFGHESPLPHHTTITFWISCLQLLLAAELHLLCTYKCGRGLIPDIVIASDAVRAQLTAETVADAARYAG